MIFGIGLGRTGTMTLCWMLKTLGLRTVHVGAHFQVIPNWASGDLVVVGDWDAIVESPFTVHYQYADEMYPNSKFILTLRDKEAWLASCARWMPGSISDNDRLKRVALCGAFGFSERLLACRYDTHVRGVRQYFENTNKLLEIDLTIAGNHWPTLASFLGITLPGSLPEIAHLNKS